MSNRTVEGADSPPPSTTLTAEHRPGNDPRVTIPVPGARRLHGFTSGWGLEFEPVSSATSLDLGVATGRSSNGAIPWLGIECDHGLAFAIAPHYSGNWRMVGVTGDEGRVEITFPDHTTATELPPVSLAWGTDLTDASRRLVKHLRDGAPAAAPILTEWNHWWPYEDADITEEVFLRNARRARELGLQAAVLDAGWFGGSGDTNWVDVRGDWDLVNTSRFPDGLARLADRTRDLGIAFGVWIEPEALGPRAQIRTTRPELVARDEAGTDLGYVCMASPEGRHFVLSAVGALIAETNAAWVKWDFNLDPGRGCGRSDHGHLPEEGLRLHVDALYDTFDQLRAQHPQVVFEACSSGGLRIDAGLAGHVDAFFLSDPDWTEHHLCCLWGASRYVAPRQILHWMESEWRGEHRFQHVDYSGTLLTLRKFDQKVQAAMLHRFGVSARLDQLRPDLADRLAVHLDAYRRFVLPLLPDAELLPLTPQPLREERGCRQPAFQLATERDHIVAAFRLPPEGRWTQPATPRDLVPDAIYEVTPLLPAAQVTTVLSGSQLMEGGLTVEDDTALSQLWHLSRRD